MQQLPESGSAPAIVLGVLQVVIGVGLFLVGRWGARNAASLVQPTLDEAERAKRSAAYRRGAIFCQLVAVVLVGTVLVSVAARALG